MLLLFSSFYFYDGKEAWEGGAMDIWSRKEGRRESPFMSLTDFGLYYIILCFSLPFPRRSRVNEERRLIPLKYAFCSSYFLGLKSSEQNGKSGVFHGLARNVKFHVLKYVVCRVYLSFAWTFREQNFEFQIATKFCLEGERGDTVWQWQADFLIFELFPLSWIFKSRNEVSTFRHVHGIYMIFDVALPYRTCSLNS